MIKNKILISYFLLFSFPVFANCERGEVAVNVIKTEPNITIDNSHSDLPDRFGDISATLIRKFILETEMTESANETCLRLTGVRAEIGYDFVVRIDKKFKPETCEYAAVLKHEYEHLNAYQSILSAADISAINKAAQNINPKTLKSSNETNAAIDAMLIELKDNPEIKIMMRGIEVESEIKNKNVDNDETDYLKDCVVKQS